MRDRLLSTTMAIAMTATVVSAFISASIRSPSAQTQATSPGEPYPTLRTPWGDPDLQGIWTDETSTPLERPGKYATQEFFTEAQRAELDKARVALPARTSARNGGPRSMSPAPIIRYSYPGSAPARARHWLSIPQMARFRR
jgi:hypothetical protein